MSTNFDTNNTDKITEHVLVEHDYYNAVLYTHMFKHTLSNGGYLQIPYYMPNSIIRHNLQYSSNLTPQKYQATNLYIFKKSHNIVGVDYDAELVIENKSVKNNDKIYACFLLKIKKFSNDNDNDIDKLLKMSKNPSTYYDDMSFHFDPLIGNQSKIIQYNSDVNRLLIFTNPVSIKEIEFGGYQTIPSSLILMEPSSYQIIQINGAKNQEGFQEGYEMMDCQLVDDKGRKKGKKTLTKLVENDSPDNKIVGVMFSIFMVMTIGWFAAPPLYQSMVMNQYKTSESITVATVFIGIIIVALGLSLSIDGFSKKYHDSTEGYIGTMILFLVAVSYVSITLSRLDKIYNPGPAIVFSTLGSGFISMLTGVFTLLKQIKYLFGQIKPTIIVGILPLFSLLLIILSIVCFVGIKNDPDAKKKEKKQKGYIKHLTGLIMGIGSIYGFMAILYYFHINYYPLPISSASSGVM
jgi:uncharacterized membrane protein